MQGTALLQLANSRLKRPLSIPTPQKKPRTKSGFFKALAEARIEIGWLELVNQTNCHCACF